MKSHTLFALAVSAVSGLIPSSLIRQASRSIVSSADRLSRSRSSVATGNAIDIHITSLSGAREGCRADVRLTPEKFKKTLMERYKYDTAFTPDQIGMEMSATLRNGAVIQLPMERFANAKFWELRPLGPHGMYMTLNVKMRLLVPLSAPNPFFLLMMECGPKCLPADIPEAVGTTTTAGPPRTTQAKQTGLPTETPLVWNSWKKRSSALTTVAPTPPAREKSSAKQYRKRVKTTPAPKAQ